MNQEAIAKRCIQTKFDFVLQYAETGAVEPLERATAWEAGEVPETYPSTLHSQRLNIRDVANSQFGEGGREMRIVSGIICVLAVALGIAAAQSGTRQVPLRYDPPAVLSTVDAVYPVQSVATGTVVLEVSLDDNGKITEVKVVRGIASLTEPAEHSVRQWKFQPAKLDGKPVPSKIVAAFSFVPPNVGPRV